MSQAPSGPKPLPRAFLSGATLWTFFALLSQKSRAFYPFTDNEGFYTYYAAQMAKGLHLYSDLWDHKPPFLFLQFFLLGKCLPLDEPHVHFFAVLVHALDGLLLWGLARKLGLGPWTAWAAPFFYGLMVLPPLLQPWAAEADLLGLPFLLAALLLAFSEKTWALVLSGALFALAFFTKQSVLLVAPAFAPLFVGKDLWKKSGRWVLGAIAAFLIFILYFLISGDFGAFWRAFEGFNGYYVGESWKFLASSPGYRNFLAQWLEVFLSVYGLSLLALLWLWVPASEREEGRTPGFLTAWSLGALVSCGLSAYFFSYYFIVLLPPLALALAAVVGKFLETRAVWRGAFLLLWLLAAGSWAFVPSGERLLFSYCQYPTERFEADKAVGLAVRQAARPGDALFCWACEPSIYAYAGLAMAVVHTPVINHLSYLTGEAQQAPANFRTQKPRFVVVSRDAQVIPEPDWLAQALKKGYEKVLSQGELDLYLER